MAKRRALSVSSNHGPQRTFASSKERIRRNSRLSQRRISTFSSISYQFNDGELLVSSKAPFKKFVEEETKKTGRVSLLVYYQYIVAASGIWFWCGIFAIQ